MKSYRNGFTLIELLAVIVILAIIAVIAVPIVLNIINETKVNASLRSADNYLHALELEIANKGINNEKYEDGVYSIDEFEIEIKGEVPQSGFVQIIDGEIDKYSLIINNNKAESKEKYDIWDGSKTSMTEGSDGNYHITKASELAWLAEKVNAGTTYEGVNFYLENNLDLNNIEWTPIGTTTNKFMGNFYGNDNVIKNIHINKNESVAQGLFGDVTGIIDGLIIKDFSIVDKRAIGILSGVSRESANISNITIYNSKVKSIEDSAGGIIGQFQGVGNNLKVINTNIEAASHVGGIIGKTPSSGTKIKELNNCYLDSSTYIYANGRYNENVSYVVGVVGGIAGWGSTLNIENSISYAAVESPETLVGGIIGEAISSSVIKNTKMYGKVKGKKIVGGIAGIINTSIISNCEVFGNISSEESTTFGALAGSASSSQVTENIVSSNLNNMEITLDNLIGSKSSDTTLANNIIK